MVSSDVRHRGHWTVVSVHGDIDVGAAPRLRSELIELLSASDQVRLVIDLQGADFVDSFGLGVLIGALKRARLAGQELALTRIPPALSRTLTLVGLDRVFPTIELTDLDPPTDVHVAVDIDTAAL